MEKGEVEDPGNREADKAEKKKEAGGKGLRFVNADI